MQATVTWRLCQRLLASPWLIRLPVRAATKVVVAFSANRTQGGSV